MLSFKNFIPDNGGTPIYLQIILYIKRAIAAGMAEDGEELPSRRVLSALLGINPNTVQKAYRLLEEEGLMESHSGAKSYLRLPPSTVEKVRAELLEADIRGVVGRLRQLGLSLTDAQIYLKNYWEDSQESEADDEST